jgi:hypothetical protein
MMDEQKQEAKEKVAIPVDHHSYVLELSSDDTIAADEVKLATLKVKVSLEELRLAAKRSEVAHEVLWSNLHDILRAVGREDLVEGKKLTLRTCDMTIVNRGEYADDEEEEGRTPIMMLKELGQVFEEASKQAAKEAKQ